jgi:hypothetical protein
LPLRHLGLAWRLYLEGSGPVPDGVGVDAGNRRNVGGSGGTDLDRHGALRAGDATSLAKENAPVLPGRS